MIDVAIAGVGVAEPGAGESPSHAELLYRATRAALDDAGLEREDITSAVTTSYDYVEGRALANQFTLDSIGGVMKPCDLRVGDDGLHALAAGSAGALAEPGGVLVVAGVQLARSEHSDETRRTVQELSYEPVLTRPIVAGAMYPEALVFGMRAQAHMASSGLAEDDLADLVARRSAANGAGSRRTAEEVLGSAVVAGPLRELHLASPTDVAAALIVSTDPPSGRVRARVHGVGWAADDALLGHRSLGEDRATTEAAGMAYEMAGIGEPRREIERAEVYNAYGIDEVLACEALDLYAGGETLTGQGSDSSLRINPTGGVQASGFARGVSSLAQTARAIGEMSANGGGTLLAQGWSGCGGSSSAVVVIEVA